MLFVYAKTDQSGLHFVCIGASELDEDPIIVCRTNDTAEANSVVVFCVNKLNSAGVTVAHSGL
jgi:hypothetical protein